MARELFSLGTWFDACSETWLTHYGVEEVPKEAIHAVAEGVNHVPEHLSAMCPG